MTNREKIMYNIVTWCMTIITLGILAMLQTVTDPDEDDRGCDFCHEGPFEAYCEDCGMFALCVDCMNDVGLCPNCAEEDEEESDEP